MICFTSVKAPFGTVIVTEEEGFITGLFLTGEDFEEWRKDAPGVKPCETAAGILFFRRKKAILSAFETKRHTLSGKGMERADDDSLRGIPKLRRYGRSDRKTESGARHGQANKRNRLPIFVPCHRVIGKNSALTGYAGTKTDVKAVLLNIEQISYKEK